ncbi:MAG: hypothetical protein JXR88_15225 [Clostridia bacterium]|nr:hypothetical protein [Clostridia bacterium]
MVFVELKFEKHEQIIADIHTSVKIHKRTELPEEFIITLPLSPNLIDSGEIIKIVINLETENQISIDTFKGVEQINRDQRDQIMFYCQNRNLTTFKKVKT